MHITLLVPGFGLPSSVIIPYEIFSNAGVLWNTLLDEPEDAPFEVITASVDGTAVTYEGGITIIPDKSVSQVRRTDLIFCPTIGLDQEPVFTRSKGLIRFLQRQAEKGTPIAGVCSGVSMLAEAGVLDGKPATTHWALAEQYRQRFPRVDWKPDLFVTEADNIFCGGGVYAAMDLCLYLIERLAGYEIARQTSRALLIDPPRTWQSSFRPSMLIHQQHRDEKIQRAEDYLHENFNAQFTMEELAGRIGMSHRNFVRRFKQATGQTPLGYLHQLRINHAKQLLETAFKSVQEVSYEVGYEDVQFFRSIFKRHTGYPPKAYRQRFGAGLAVGR